jgi:hypothetical protein
LASAFAFASALVLFSLYSSVLASELVSPCLCFILASVANFIVSALFRFSVSFLVASASALLAPAA